MTARLQTTGVFVLALALLALAACGDDGGSPAGNGTAATDGASPSPSPTVTRAPGLACELLDESGIESVLGPVFTQQPIEPDDFEICFAFVNGGEVVLEACEGCLTNEEFDERVESVARGRETEAEVVSDAGDEAYWVPAGDADPNTGLLWVRSGDLVLNLWLKLRTYDDEAAAQADAIEMTNNILASTGAATPTTSA